MCQCVSVFHEPGADRHFHWGINAVTGCLVANFPLQHCLGLFFFFFLDVNTHAWVPVSFFGQ